MEIIAFLFAPIIEFSLGLYLMSSILETVFSGFKKWICIFAFALVQFFILIFVYYYIHLNSLPTVFLIFSYFLYTILFLKGSFIKKVAVSFLPIIIPGILNFLIPYFISILFGLYSNHTINQFGTIGFVTLIITKITYFAVLLIILYFKNKLIYNYSSKQWFVFGITQSVVTVILFLMFEGIRSSSGKGMSDSFFIMACICLIGVYIITLILINRINRMNEIKTENMLLEQQNSYQAQSIKMVEQTHRELQQIKHDIKNDFLALSIMLSNNKIDDAKAYISDFVDTRIDNRLFLVDTDNEAINAILSGKYGECAFKRIKLFIEITSGLRGVPSADVCALLANLLDNAIDASEGLEGGEIRLIIKREGNQLCISVKNRIEKSVLKINPKLLSSKEDKGIHGYGTKSVENIVKKYGGMIKYTEEDSMFICKAILKIEG